MNVTLFHEKELQLWNVGTTFCSEDRHQAQNGNEIQPMQIFFNKKEPKEICVKCHNRGHAFYSQVPMKLPGFTLQTYRLAAQT